jgi:hypothetical protein
MTEVVVLDARRENQIVIWKRALAREHEAGERVNSEYLRHEDRHVLLPTQDRADRRRNLVRREEASCDLVEHGPEEMIVVLINNRDGHRHPCEPARSV